MSTKAKANNSANMHQFLSMPGHENDIDSMNGIELDQVSNPEVERVPPKFIRNNFDDYQIDSFKNFQHIDHGASATNEEADREAVQEALKAE